MEQNEKMKAYWKENLTYITILMAIWFGVSYLAGILIANPLDNIRVGGMGLGFWFANQGFPEGRLGELMALALEIKINGLEGLIEPLKRTPTIH